MVDAQQLEAQALQTRARLMSDLDEIARWLDVARAVVIDGDPVMRASEVKATNG